MGILKSGPGRMGRQRRFRPSVHPATGIRRREIRLPITSCSGVIDAPIVNSHWVKVRWLLPAHGFHTPKEVSRNVRKQLECGCRADTATQREARILCQFPQEKSVSVIFANRVSEETHSSSRRDAGPIRGMATITPGRKEQNCHAWLDSTSMVG